MATFIAGLIVLFAGGALYGNFVTRIFKPDDRPTPAVKHDDGVDFVPMSKFKNAMINLLNIAGTGPIFGPIQGILFGPIAFITIPIGCVISGATHDYLSGMLSMRQNGAQMPMITKKFLGNKTYHVYNFFLCLLMLLVGAVFTYTPGDLFATQILGIKGITPATWIIYGVILAYYLIATLFPIDKIIGKIYPVFGAILLMSAVGVFGGMFVNGYELTELDLSNGIKGIFDIYPLWNAEGNTGAGTAFIPVFFVTVACGITSGFHSTQCALISRSVRSEKEGNFTFYWTMILEGFIAMIWAAAAMGLYNKGSLANYTGVVGEVSRDLLGSVGGVIAILGVIILPITSGDTALRSCRLMLSEYLHIDQKCKRNRVLVTLGIFVPVIAILIFAKLNTQGFNILWRYFAWSNQTIAVFAFAAISVYLQAKKDAPKFAHLISLLPGTFYLFIVSSFILSQSIGFGLPLTLSYIIGAAASALYFFGITYIGKKYATKNIEE
ncbi:MAG: carbon starvation protein A [Ruminococcaceae bacterium]|nr:carbon starvation protein A [Oscillospiraceae bacterium]